MHPTKSRILDAAGNIFGLGGIGMTMEAVRLEAGVCSGSIRNFFPNLEALAGALFEQLHVARIERMTTAIRRHPGKPAAGIVALLRGELAFAAERPMQARVHQMLAAMAWSEEKAPGIANWRAKQDEQLQRSLGDLLGGAGPAAPLTALTLAIEGCASRLVADALSGVLAMDMDKAASDVGVALREGFGIPLKAAKRPDRAERSRKASPQPDFFAAAASPEPDTVPGR